MRITELFTAQSIALDEALQTQEEILSRLVELQATHGNITDKDAYKRPSTPARPRALPMWTTASPCPTPRRLWSPAPAWPPCG